MGNNAAFAMWERRVITAYDAGCLTLASLDMLSEVYRGTDIDSGGSEDLQTKDGKFAQQIAVALAEPGFEESESWNVWDEFCNLSSERWGWK